MRFFRSVELPSPCCWPPLDVDHVQGDGERESALGVLLVTGVVRVCA